MLTLAKRPGVTSGCPRDLFRSLVSPFSILTSRCPRDLFRSLVSPFYILWRALTWRILSSPLTYDWNSKRLNCFLCHAQWPTNLTLRRIIGSTNKHESASKLYRPSDCRLSAKLVPAFVDRRYHVVSVTDPYGIILSFLDRSRYFFFQVAPHLYSRDWVDPVPENLVAMGIETGLLDL
jgi:hypothetical protein